MITVIAYIFGIFIATAYIYMAFISRTMNKNRYKARLILSVISIAFGLAMEYSHLFNKPFGDFIIFGLSPITYLVYYEILRRLMRPLIGKYPYAPHWNKVGDKIKGNGYPKNRLVTKNDYLFGLSMLFIPMITLLILLTIKN
jgi:hypothetical protein